MGHWDEGMSDGDVLERVDAEGSEPGHGYTPRGRAARSDALKRYDGGPRVSLDDYLERAGRERGRTPTR